MSRTTYYTATTLDGYIADEADSLEWLFTQAIDHEGAGGYEAFIANVGSLVMGATTYRWVLDHLEADGEPWPYSLPCVVATHREHPVPDGADIRFAAADDADAVRALHAELVAVADGKDVWVVGGGGLAAAFADAGCLDELALQIAPVTLGAGKPLLPRPFDLELLELERNDAFAVARYRVVGAR